jgi:hypothetical protein
MKKDHNRTAPREHVEAGDLPRILEASLAPIGIRGVSAITDHTDIFNNGDCNTD